MLRKRYAQTYRPIAPKSYRDLARLKAIQDTTFEFPKGVHLHYLTSSKDVFNPSVNTPFLRSVDRGYIHHVTNTTVVPEKAIVRMAGINNEVIKYQQQNRKFKSVQSPVELGEIGDQFLTLTNYEWLKQVYQFQPQPYLDYHRSLFLLKSLVTGVQAQLDVDDRDHFIYYELGNVPSLPDTNRYLAGNRELQKVYNSPHEVMLLELMRWLTADSHQSSLFHFTNKNGISQAHRVNLLISFKQRLTFINLGYLELVTDGLLKGVDESSELLIISALNARFIRASGKVPERVIKTLILGGLSGLKLGEDDIVTYDDVVDESDEEIDDFTREEDIDYLEEAVAVAETLQQKAGKAEIATGEIDVDVALWNEASETQESNLPLEDKLIDQLERRSEDLGLSRTVHRALESNIREWPTKRSPFDPDKSVRDTMAEKSIEIDADTYASVARDHVPDSRILTSTLAGFDKDYLKKSYRADTLAMVSKLQEAGIVIEDYEVDTVRDISGGYEIHKLRTRPIDGTVSTLEVKIPSIDDEGVMTYNNTSYRLKRQLGDLPIRKISPSRVGLTSYYGKLFVQRNENTSVNIAKWLDRQITLTALREGDSYLAVPNNAHDNLLKGASYYYGSISLNYTRIKVNNIEYTFDYKNRFKGLDPDKVDAIKTLEKEYQSVFVGIKEGNALLVDSDDTVFYHTQGERKGDIPLLELLLITKDPPMEEALVTIMGLKTPVIIVLGYLYGLKQTMDSQKIRYRAFGVSDKTVGIFDRQIVLKLNNAKLVIEHTKLSELIISPLYKLRKVLAGMTLSDLNEQGTYFRLLNEIKGTFRHAREFELLNTLYIDPITEEILVEMGEPTRFQGLLERSVELLTTLDYSDTADKSLMRIKGLERINGFIYNELIKSVRGYQNRRVLSRQKLEMNPVAVWKAITTDPTWQLKEDVNPIQYLKEIEVTTLTGHGGRSKEALSTPVRIYTKSDIGIISEATVDSGDVGVTAYMPSNPTLKNLRGMRADIDPIELAPSQILSTSALLSAGVEKDDAKRRNFISIQHSHTVASASAHPPIVRTGMESVIADRVGSLYATTAKASGTITKVTPNAVEITYDDGRVEVSPVGKRFGRAEGKYFPHTLVSNCKVGDKLSKGDVLSYNHNFFEPDLFNPKQVVLKTGKDYLVAFIDSLETNEDSSVISRKVSKEFVMTTSKIKKVLIRFDQHISHLVKEGDEVTPHDPLLIITDILTNESNLLSEEARAILNTARAQVPRAKVKGIVSKVSIYYRGEKKEMTPSLRKVADTFDKKLKQEAEDRNESPLTGQVTADYRIASDAIPENHAEIVLYIDVPHDTEVSDKIVVGHQQKSVVGSIMDYTVKTQYGDEVDIVFSMRSVTARIVLSVLETGAMGTTLRYVGRDIATRFLKP